MTLQSPTHPAIPQTDVREFHKISKSILLFLLSYLTSKYQNDLINF